VRGRSAFLLRFVVRFVRRRVISFGDRGALARRVNLRQVFKWSQSEKSLRPQCFSLFKALRSALLVSVSKLSLLRKTSWKKARNKFRSCVERS